MNNCICGKEIGETAKRCRRCARLGRLNASYKHGGRHTRLYNIWCNMLQRCFNENHFRYKRYGERDIYVEDISWFEFIPFRDWSLANGYKEGLTIDRIDNDDGYYPENCQWIAKGENTKKDHTKPVNQYDLVGNLIAVYPSIVEAERQTGATHIYGVCGGHRKKSGGYGWAFAP